MQGLPEPATAPLLERDHDLERLEEAIRAARNGTGAVVVVEGAAGIGKTALLTEARQRARAAGMAVACARGSELEREFAFGVVRQLLEPVLVRADAAARAEILAGVAAVAEPLLRPAALPRHEPRAGADQTFSILHGLYWVCANLAQRRPLLVAVDDAHWADLASLRFLAYLAQRLEGLPLALVVAARPAEEPAGDELLARLEREPGAIAISPAPLSAAAVAMLIAAHAAQDPEAEFAEACRRATGGVPLLVRELVRALDEEGVEPVGASVARVERIGPRTIARHVVARVRRLAPAAERIARAAAVLGADAQLGRVIELAGVDEDAALDALDALSHAGVIASTRPLEFSHPVVRAAVYEDLAPGERTRMHARAASLLAAERVDDERVASHLLATEPRGAAEVVEVLLRTARTAAARGAPSSAVAYLERALAEAPAAERRGVVLHELGVAEYHSGLHAQAGGHLQEAFRLAPRGRERALIAQDLAGCLRLAWRHEEAADVTSAALSELGREDEDLALALRAELVVLEALEPTAHATVERAPEPPVRRSEGTAKYLAALTTDAVVRSSAPAEEARRLAAGAREAGIVEDLAHGGSLWINVVGPLIIADGFSLAEEMIGEAFAAARRQGSLIFTARAYVARSMLRIRQGALADAEADAQAALATTGDARFYFPLLSLAVLVDALCERGDRSTADEALERVDMGGEIPDTFVHNWVLDSRGRLRLAQGRLDAALADLDALARRTERRRQPNPGVHPHRSTRALALLRRGDAERARALAEAELAMARRWGAPRAVGMSLRALGLCAGGEVGMDRLRESVEVLERSGARLEHARALVDLGAALRRSGRRAEAREPLSAGMELAHRCGAAPLVEAAREELLATGARPRRIMRTGVAALTPGELRVARMAAEGMSNREIAQALFVTARTVEGHLTHVFRKLDVASRVQLAERLAAG